MRRKIRVKSTYLKTTFLLTNSLSYILKGIGVSREGLQSVHRLLVTIDLLVNVFILPILYLLKIWIPSKIFEYVLVEEHLPGILVDYIHLTKIFKLPVGLMQKLIKIILYLIPLPSKTLTMSCSLSVLPLRWRQRGSPPEHIEYLKTQHYVFALWNKYIENAFTISTDAGSAHETAKKIRKIILRSTI